MRRADRESRLLEEGKHHPQRRVVALGQRRHHARDKRKGRRIEQRGVEPGPPDTAREADLGYAEGAEVGKEAAETLDAEDLRFRAQSGRNPFQLADQRIGPGAEDEPRQRALPCDERQHAP